MSTNPPPASDATPTAGAMRDECRAMLERIKDFGLDDVRASLREFLNYYGERTPTPGAGGAGDVGEMEKLARLATPGPWNVVYDTNVKGTRRDVGYETVIANTGTFSSNACDVTPENQANAAFIAAANPAAVLALIAERDALRAAVEKLPKTADGAPIVLGGAVFYDNRDRELRQPFTDKDFPKVRVVGLFLLGNAHSGPQDMRKVELLAGGSSGSEMGQRCRCYSTLEAALARGPAAGETTDGGGKD